MLRLTALLIMESRSNVKSATQTMTWRTVSDSTAAIASAFLALERT